MASGGGSHLQVSRRLTAGFDGELHEMIGLYRLFILNIRPFCIIKPVK